MSGEPLLRPEIIHYQTEDGRMRLEVRLQDETVWLTQKLMAELFQTSVPNVNMHIHDVFAEGELQAGSVVKEFFTTAADLPGGGQHGLPTQESRRASQMPNSSIAPPTNCPGARPSPSSAQAATAAVAGCTSSPTEAKAAGK